MNTHIAYMKKKPAKQSLTSLLVLTSLVSSMVSGVVTYASISLAEDSPPPPPQTSDQNSSAEEQRRLEELRKAEELKRLEELRLEEQRKNEALWRNEDAMQREKERLEGITTGRDWRIECYKRASVTNTVEKVKCTHPECNLGFCRKEMKEKEIGAVRMERKGSEQELLQREIEERMKLAEEKNTSEKIDSFGKISVLVKDSMHEPFTSTREQLGCFTETREWTTDRKECDLNQGRHFMGTQEIVPERDSTDQTSEPKVEDVPTPVEENEAENEELRMRMHEKFLAEKRQRQQEELLGTIGEAVLRLKKIQEKVELPAEAAEYLNETINWLGRIEADQALGDVSTDEVLAAAKEVRLSTQEVSEVLKETGWKEPAREERRQGITTIAGKIEKILSKMPQIIGLFTVAPEGAEAAYQKARTSFDEANTACEADLNLCKNFGATLDALEELKAVIDNAITVSGNTLLRERMESLLRN